MIAISSGTKVCKLPPYLNPLQANMTQQKTLKELKLILYLSRVDKNKIPFDPVRFTFFLARSLFLTMQTRNGIQIIHS